MNPFTIGQRVKPESFIGRTALIRRGLRCFLNWRKQKCLR
jgi:hypothetical protein